MKKLTTKVICLSFIFSMISACFGMTDEIEGYPEPTPNFYKKYPVYKKFFPYGVFGGGGFENAGYTSNNILYMNFEEGYRFMAEILRDNYLNLIWGGDYNNCLIKKEGKYVLDNKGELKTKWLKKTRIYVMPVFWNWFGVKRSVGEVYRELKGKNVWLTNEQIDNIIKKHKAKFEAMRMLKEKLGDRMISLIMDDEPGGLLKSTLSAIRAMKKFLPDLPLTTVVGSKAACDEYTPYMELLCFESYGKAKWQTRDQLLRAYRKSPYTIFWNDILAASYALEPTLPHFPDNGVTPAEVRLACWQSLAGGAKGIIYYLFRLYPNWWIGSKSFCNQLGKESRSHTLPAIKKLGKILTSTGALLLSCHPVESDTKKVKFATRKEYFVN